MDSLIVVQLRWALVSTPPLLCVDAHCLIEDHRFSSAFATALAR
ncbi:MAG: hypothetical protein AB8A35_01215 [Prochlorococcus sp.]